jgi:hypothetical protein
MSDQLKMSAMIEAFERHVTELKNNFKTRGITDLASETRLVVFDDSVVVENNLVAGQDLNVGGNLVVDKDLVIKGNMNTDHVGFQRIAENAAAKAINLLEGEVEQRIVDRVIERAAESGIDFAQVSIGGQPLVSNGILSGEIRTSNISKLGTLSDLDVKGPVNLNGTLYVRDGRIGVNTTTPEMAVTVWDNDVCLVAGRSDSNRAFIGTGRRNNLDIGVNQTAAIEINTDGEVNIPNLRLGRNRIGFSTTPPGWEGAKGDMVFNINTETDVLGWRCLGAFRWQALKISI